MISRFKEIVEFDDICVRRKCVKDSRFVVYLNPSRFFNGFDRHILN